jgi:hypothetical protein
MLTQSSSASFRLRREQVEVLEPLLRVRAPHAARQRGVVDGVHVPEPGGRRRLAAASRPWPRVPPSRESPAMASRCRACRTGGTEI